MSRDDFIRQLEMLLEDVPQEEKQEALSYYQSYFEDAGTENEERILRELESPQKVAATIKADLGMEAGSGMGEYTEHGFTDSRFQDRQELNIRGASSQEQPEGAAADGRPYYGEKEPNDRNAYGNEKTPNCQDVLGNGGTHGFGNRYENGETPNNQNAYEKEEHPSYQNDYGNGEASGYGDGSPASYRSPYGDSGASYEDSYGNSSSASYDDPYRNSGGASYEEPYREGNHSSYKSGNDASYGSSYRNGSESTYSGNQALKVVLLIAIAVLTSPVWLSLIGGGLGTVFAIAVAAVCVTVSFFMVGGILFGVGIGQMAAGSLGIGFALSGVGMLILALAVLCTLLCVWICSKLIPWLCRAVKGLWRGFFSRKEQRI